MPHWLFKHNTDRWVGANGPDTRWSVASHLYDIASGDNAAMFVVKQGFVSLGMVTVPTYRDGGYDPAYAVDPADTTTDHWYVGLSLPVTFAHDPIPWSAVATRPMGPRHPVPLSNDEWLRLLIEAAKRMA